MTFETQKNFLGKTQTILMAEARSERWLSWIRLSIGIIYAVIAIFGILLGKTSPAAFLIQSLSIIVLITYSSLYLTNRNFRLHRVYFTYVLIFMDVLVITAILWSYFVNGAGFNIVTSAIFGTYFIVITFTALHHKASLSIFCGLLSVVGYSILYFIYSYHSSFSILFTNDYLFRLVLLMTIAGLVAVVSRNNSHTIQQVISSEIRYHNLVHRLPEMLCTLDSHGNFLWANMASHALLGIPAKVVVGRNIRSFLINPSVLRLDKGWIKGTFEISDFNGVRKFVDCVFQSVDQESGNAAFDGIISDVTDRELAISQREEMVNRLFQYQKMESLGTLASGMAHDFNNILQSVNDITEQVEKQSQESETIKKMELIKETMADARFLISELFALGRKKPLDYKVINLDTFLQSVVAQYSNQLGPNFSLTYEPMGNPVWIQGDPDYLKRVFQNLIGNSRDAMPGGGRILVSCTSVQGDGNNETVVIRVSDTGTGIPHELTEKIFDPFYTTKKPGKGTGLGLALVRRIIMLHNGNITVEKTGYEGTVFRIELPISDEESFESDTKSILSFRLPTTVLLLDDDPKIREVLKIFLKEFKYSVIEASSREEAINELQANIEKCEIVIMDWNLGNENPHEIIKTLRTIKKNLIVIVVSGYAPQQKSIQSMEIHKWFTKPYDKNQLDIEIQRALHRIHHASISSES
ncbi:MAG: response regulator [Fibrobacter sp.]|jgi:PAS domain S-box-containing protein|nr:response regulator [Fibrobacter sp.]